MHTVLSHILCISGLGVINMMEKFETRSLISAEVWTIQARALSKSQNLWIKHMLVYVRRRFFLCVKHAYRKLFSTF